MKLKFIIPISVVFVISIFSNIALAFNVVNKGSELEKINLDNTELQKELKSLETALNKAESTIKNEKLTNNQDAKELVTKFFKTQYEYDSTNYKGRFKKIEKFVSEGVYGQLTTAGIPEVPNVNFENHINDMKLFLTAHNNEIVGLVLLDTSYVIDGFDSPETTQIFEVKVTEHEGKQKIVSLEILGTFASMAES
ncbi:hypothetical protein [Virgibacillus sp. Bac332]|uniref:hypothetical protein n=1 Tax=Virgibacillus sp. Bac332 TaxID=2419842 RepID=UPI000EF45BC9|nr:hypothetical protein [Virgibacillus sp. Bac332]